MSMLDALQRELLGRIKHVLPGTIVRSYSDPGRDELIISYVIRSEALTALRGPAEVVRALCQCDPLPELKALERQRQARMRMAIAKFKLGRSR
jgi:hypothetical protein